MSSRSSKTGSVTRQGLSEMQQFEGTVLRSLWLPVQHDSVHPRNPADRPGAWHSSATANQDQLIMALLGNQSGGYFVERPTYRSQTPTHGPWSVTLGGEAFALKVIRRIICRCSSSAPAQSWAQLFLMCLALSALLIVVT